MKHSYSKLAGISLVGLLSLCDGCKGESEKISNITLKPNILIILPDDLGWSDIGYHGSEIKTPHLDKLAQTGIRFHNHYSMATCTPTRVSLFTGRYPSRYGIVSPDYGKIMEPGETTLASVLARNGYSTHQVGKWHMGSPPNTPLKYGFQSSYGYFAGQIDPYTHEYKTESELASRRTWHRNDEYVDEQGHVTDLLTDEAIRIIESNKGKPFFLYLAHHVPHHPLNEPEEWLSQYDRLDMFPSRQLFAASITHMDDGIGKVLAALDRTGQRDNTVIIFVSDNGGQNSYQSDTEYQGRYADKPHTVLGNNYPLRGWKGDLYEGGIRVPAFINWPGKIKPGRINLPVHVSDWLPTICDIVGDKESFSGSKLDGRSILPELTGNGQITSNRPIYWKTGSTFAVRDGDWKLIVQRNNNMVELYNLEIDFRESKNLAGSNPKITEHLLNLLEEFKTGDIERLPKEKQ